MQTASGAKRTTAAILPAPVTGSQPLWRSTCSRNACRISRATGRLPRDRLGDRPGSFLGFEQLQRGAPILGDSHPVRRDEVEVLLRVLLERLSIR